MMKRREFVTASAAAVGSSLLGLEALAETFSRRATAPSDEIHVGVIGVGSRGKSMMRQFLRLPGVKVTALCDVYEPRFGTAAIDRWREELKDGRIHHFGMILAIQALGEPVNILTALGDR